MGTQRLNCRLHGAIVARIVQHVSIAMLNITIGVIMREETPIGIASYLAFLNRR
jgi:hypothetical protein